MLYNDKIKFTQDVFLNALQNDKTPVSIYLVNGIKLQGVVECFDEAVLVLKNSTNQMVFKHAISTVVPVKNVNLNHRASIEEVEDGE